MSITHKLAVIILTSFLISCSTNREENNDLIICTSIPPLADFAKNIVGNRAVVHTLIPAGANLHSFEPSPESMKIITNSDIFIRVGKELQFEEILLNKIDRTDIGNILDMSKFVNIEDNDPHIWLSPQHVRKMMDVMLGEFSKALPQHKLFFANNKRRYIHILDSLDFELKKIIDKKSERYLFVYHPAWRYFADYYSLRQISIEKMGKSPKAGDLKSAIKDAVESRISCIFFDPHFNEGPAISIARELNLNTVSLNPLPAHYLSNLKDIVQKLDKHLK